MTRTTIRPLDPHELAQVQGHGQPEPVPWNVLMTVSTLDLRLVELGLRPPPLPWLPATGPVAGYVVR